MQPTAPSKDSNVTFWHRRTSSDSNQSSTRPLCPVPTLPTVFFTTLHSNGCHKAVAAAKKVIVAGLKADANSCLSRQEFLKKEFSEENILFWQACEYFSQVPATDKKQVKHSRTLIRLWHSELAVIFISCSQHPQSQNIPVGNTLLTQTHLPVAVPKSRRDLQQLPLQ